MVASFSTESPAQRRAQANTVPERSTCSNSTVKTFAACEPYPSCCAALIRLRSDRTLTARSSAVTRARWAARHRIKAPRLALQVGTFGSLGRKAIERALFSSSSFHDYRRKAKGARSRERYRAAGTDEIAVK